MRQTFTIHGTLPSLNEFYTASHFAQGKMKRDCDDLVAWSAKAARVAPYHVPIRYHVLWVEPNHKRDLDNVAFAKKFIQDGLVKAGILHNDTHHEIVGFSDEFEYDAKNPRIVVTLEEA